MKKVLSLVVVAVVALTACSSSSSAGAAGAGASQGGSSPSGGGGGTGMGSGGCANTYYPVATGNSWTYTDTNSLVAPTVYTDTIGKVASDGFTVLSKFPGLTKTAQWKCTSAGLVSTTYGAGPSAAIQTSASKSTIQTTNVTGVTIPADMKPGDTWRQSFTISGTTTIGASAQSVQEKGTVTMSSKAIGASSVTVPAGNYTALLVQTTSTMKLTIDMMGATVPVDTVFKGTEWFVQGVGMVQEVTKGTIMGSTVTAKVTLKSYSQG
jgi:hypothetical protein